MESLSICANRTCQAGFRDRSARVLTIILLALSITLPATIQPVKILLLMLIIILVFIGMLANRAALSWHLYFFSCFYAFIGLFWSFYGEVCGNPGAVKVMTVMVCYPLVIPLCASLYRENDGDSLYRIFLICAWIIVVLDLIYALAYSTYAGNMLQAIFNYLYSGYLGETIMVNTDTYIKRFSLINFNSMVILLPFFISSLFFPKRGSGRMHIFLIVLLSLFLAVLAGRRGLLVSMIAGPAIAFLLTINRSHNLVKAKETSSWGWLLLVVLTILTCLYLMFEWAGAEDSAKMLGSIFNFTEDKSNLDRVYQFHSLMRGIYDAPMFGHGAGAAADYIRSNEMPWAYELTYIAIIFQYGLIGFVLYALGIVFLCWHLISSSKNNGRASFEYYYLSSFISVVIVNATNPYITAFDSMWMIFIPYAIVNAKLLSKKRQTYNIFAQNSVLADPQK